MNETVIVRETVTAGIRRFTLDQQRKATSAMYKAANDIKTAAQRRLVFRTSAEGPGGRSDGHLANSIVVSGLRSTPTLISVRVGPGVAYARYVEGYPQAPRRHFLSFKTAPDLMRWLLKHNVDVPPNAKGWMVGGPRSVTPFMRPAADEIAPKLIPQLAAALRV
jgi:hypothetical protein